MHRVPENHRGHARYGSIRVPGRGPKRPLCEVVTVKPKLTVETPGYWRCQSCGVYAEEICRPSVELTREKPYVQVAELDRGGSLWIPDDSILISRFLNGATGFDVSLLGFGQVFPSYAPTLPFWNWSFHSVLLHVGTM